MSLRKALLGHLHARLYGHLLLHHARVLISHRPLLRVLRERHRRFHHRRHLRLPLPLARGHGRLHSRQPLAVLPHELDDVRHGEIRQAVAPRHLQHHVRLNQVVAREQARREALLLALRHEEVDQVVHQCGVARLGRGVHRVPVKLVLLGQLDRLLEAPVLLVQVRADPPELYALVLEELVREADLIKVVEVVDVLAVRRSQSR